MRLILTAVIWLVVLGGLNLFTGIRHQRATGEGPVFAEAEGAFTLEVSASFGGEKDPFALNIGEEESHALRILLLGEEVFAGSEFKANELFVIEDVEGLIEGRNEFFIEASPPSGAYNQVHALRLRVLRDGVPVDQYTLWSEPGERIAGACEIDLTVTERDDDHEH